MERERRRGSWQTDRHIQTDTNDLCSVKREQRDRRKGRVGRQRRRETEAETERERKREREIDVQSGEADKASYTTAVVISCQR